MLTIAIPTYNRADFLDLCLTRVGEELVRLGEDQRGLVKVYVSNNASTDNTREVIARHQLKLAGEFDVVHNVENIGGERNVAQCYTAATTPYVWVLGDDDVILIDGLQKVMAVLFPQDVDILYVGNYWFQDDYGQRPGRRENHGTLKYSDSVAYARKTGVMLTFISGLIVKSSIKTTYYDGILRGGNLPQLGWVLPLLRDGKKFAVIEDWVLAAKGSNSGGYGLVKVFGTNLVRITDEILKEMPDVARAIQNGAIVDFFPGFVLELRKGNSQFSDKDMAAGLKEAFGDNWRYCVFLVPLLWLPLFVASYYHMLIKIFRRFFHSVLV